MLSVLIPIYNYNIISLAESLLAQCEEAGTDYEIIFADDCSSDVALAEKNAVFLADKGLKYSVMKQNLGRSKIRNLLAGQAKGDVLLFLDCDSAMVKDDFIKTYLNNIDAEDIICGGTVYCPKTDVGKDKILHWKNGKSREEGKKHFTTNNFLVKKDVFKKVCFNEQIKGYGHEDTLFACEVRNNGFKISFIHNPVIHLGLNDTEKFIGNLINSSKNLAILFFNSQYQNDLQDLSLVKAYQFLEKIHCTDLYFMCIKPLIPFITKKLHKSNPNLRYLDLLKLYYFISVAKH